MTKGTLNSTINTIFQDNVSGAITPFLLRQGFLDVVSSMQQFGCVSAHTGTTYTFLTSDYGCLSTFNNGASVNVTLPAPNSAGFNPWNTFISNYGAGNVVITPAAGTIGGFANFTLTFQQGMWVVSDGSNYQIFLGGGGSGSGGTLSIGEPINGGTNNGILFSDSSNLLADNGPFINTTLALPTLNGQWTIGATTTLGAVIAGQGSIDDFQLQNSKGTPVLSVPTSSTNVVFNSLTTVGTIAESICATSAGQLVASVSNNCFAGGGVGTPGGMTTQVQFNTNGAFGGITGVTSDSAGFGMTTATVSNSLTAAAAQFVGLASGTTAQFQTFTGVRLTLTGNMTGTTANLSGNLTGTTAQFTGAVSGTTAQFQTYTGSTLNLTGNLTGTTAQLSGALTGTTAQFQTFNGSTLNLTGNLTGTTAQFSGALTGTTGVFQTLTVSGLTPTGPNCLQETGGVLQATNSACAAAGGSVGGSNTQIQFNNNGAFAGDAGFTETTPGIITITSGLVTTTTRALSVNQTWNSSGITFGGPFLVNVVTSGAASNSTLADFQVSGASEISILANPSGQCCAALQIGRSSNFANQAIAFAGSNTVGLYNDAGTGLTQNINAVLAAASRWTGAGFSLAGTIGGISFGNSTDGSSAATYDTNIYRDSAAGVIAIGNSTTNAGSLRVYNSTDNPNSAVAGRSSAFSAPGSYSRGVMDWVTATPTILTFGTQNGGTGTGGNISIVVSNTRQMLITTTSVSAANSLNIPNIAQLSANTTGYACWTTGTGALSEDSVTCLASMRALKMNINPFSEATAELVALKPSTFQWRTPADRNQQGQQLGFVAEDVEAVDPRLVSHIADGSVHGWRQDAMIALLVRGFQEQQREIADLKERLARVRQ